MTMDIENRAPSGGCSNYTCIVNLITQVLRSAPIKLLQTLITANE